MKKYNITTDQHTEIKNREFTVVKFTTNGKEYTCYSKLMQYLISDNPTLTNKETNQPESVERGEVLDVYTIAYDKGREMFRTDIKPDASIEYLIEQYNEHYNGWKTTSEAISLFLTQSQVERMGQAAGIRYEFEIYRQKKRNEFEKMDTISQSTKQTKTSTKPPVELSMKYIVEQHKAYFREVEIKKHVEKELRKSDITHETAVLKNSIICERNLLQKLHADFDGKIWENVELETFLNFMRIEPIGRIIPIKTKSTNKDFAKWLHVHIETQRNISYVPNFGNWFKKLIGKNINYSSLIAKN